MPQESFWHFFRYSPQGRVSYALGCLYAAGWIFFFIAGAVAGHESPTATFSSSIPIGGHATHEHHILYFRPWIAWWLNFGPLVMVGLFPLVILAQWLRWRRSRAA